MEIKGPNIVIRLIHTHSEEGIRFDRTEELSENLSIIQYAVSDCLQRNHRNRILVIIEGGVDTSSILVTLAFIPWPDYFVSIEVTYRTD